MRTVRPEFLKRIDEVILFEPLSQTDIRDILRMQKELVNLLAKSILDGTVRRDSTIFVDVKEGQIVVRSK